MSIFDLSSREAVRRARERDGSIHAFVTTRFDEALAEDDALAGEAPRSPLHRVPYSLKDEWDTAGTPTTAGSYRHRHRVPTTSCSVHSVFREAGAVLLGKTNLSDLGLAPEASSYVGGAVRNPHALDRTAGGSSGGAAAAVADGMSAFDWGTDIGGSVRMPAGFCGIYGMRLSSATWPVVGLFPELPPALAWMCGQGPITRTIAQMRVLLDVAAPLRTGQAASFTPRGAVLLAPRRPGQWRTFESDVIHHVQAAAGEVVRSDASLVGTHVANDVYGALWASHFEELLRSDPSISLGEGLRAVLSGVILRGALGDRRMHPGLAELLALIVLGRITIYRDRGKALDGARRIQDAFDAVWGRGLLVVAPTCSYPAPRLGKLNRRLHYLDSTVPGNISDATGLAMPFGRFADGLPRSLQVMGPPGSEQALLDFAERFASSSSMDGDTERRV